MQKYILKESEYRRSDARGKAFKFFLGWTGATLPVRSSWADPLDP